MNSAVLLQHDDSFGPGRLIPLLRDYGIPTQIRKLHKGDEVPRSPGEARMLILLGGTMRVNDVVGKLPFVDQEIAIAKQFIERDLPIIGIGFGSELLALAGGGKVSLLARQPLPPKVPPSPQSPQSPPSPASPDSTETPPPPAPPTPTPELGWHPVSFPFPGGTEPIVFGMVDGTPFFHWHFDQYTLPALPPPAVMPPPPARPPTGNATMASSKLNRTQAWRFKNSVFGFHFHFELERQQIEEFIAKESGTINSALGGEAIEKMKLDTASLYPRYERAGEKLTRNLVQFLKAY